MYGGDTTDSRATHLLVEIDVVQDLEGLVVVAQQAVQAAQADKAEVPQHLVQRELAELASGLARGEEEPSGTPNQTHVRYFMKALTRCAH